MHNRLKHIRQMLGLRQVDFCSALRLHRAYYSRLENGVRPITEKTICKLQDVYRINGDWLRYGKGEPFLKKAEPIAVDAIEEIAKQYGFSNDASNFLRAFAQLPDDDKKSVDNLIRAFLAMYRREATDERSTA